MLYRITISSTTDDDKGEEIIDHSKRVGCGMVAGWFMAEIGLPCPDEAYENYFEYTPEARFWFTEEGWENYGVKIKEYVIKNFEELSPKVLKVKLPDDAARIIYQDDNQVAMLPYYFINPNL